MEKDEERWWAWREWGKLAREIDRKRERERGRWSSR